MANMHLLLLLLLLLLLRETAPVPVVLALVLMLLLLVLSKVFKSTGKEELAALCSTGWLTNLPPHPACPTLTPPSSMTCCEGMPWYPPARAPRSSRRCWSP